jgi:hypothetical protein
MRRFTSAAPAAALALIAGLTLAGCGDKDAPTATGGGDSGASAARESGGGDLTQANFADEVFNAILDAGSTQIHFESGTGGKKFIGEGEVKYGDELAVRMTMPDPAGGDAKQEMVMIGDTMYMGMGDKYMSMSMEAMREQGMPDMSANLDPKKQQEAFEAAVTDFKQSGKPESLDGVEATPYVITLDPSKSPETFGATTSSPLTFTYFIGPDNLPRKMVYDDKNGEFVATYTDWGKSVDIKAPPDADVMHMGDMGGMG